MVEEKNLIQSRTDETLYTLYLVVILAFSVIPSMTNARD